MYKKAARELGIPYKDVQAIYSSYWKFIKCSISDLELEGMDEEGFNNTDTNFNIPFIGKLYTNYNKV